MATPTPLIKVRVVNRARYFNGRPQPVGTVLEMNPQLAKEWLYNRWGEIFVEAPSQVKAPAAPATDEKKTKRTSE